MTAAGKATTAPAQVVETRPVGSSSPWRRRLAYAILIGYAILMFIPFGWSVITSFKTLPDSVNLNIIPQPFTTAGWEYALTKLDPPLPVLFVNSAIIALAVTITNLVLGSIAGYAFARLRFPVSLEGFYRTPEERPVPGRGGARKMKAGRRCRRPAFGVGGS